MTTKPFFVKVSSDLLARTDLSMTRKVILSYLTLRSGIPGWTFNATDLETQLGICYETARRETKQLEVLGVIKCIGYSHKWQKRYKKYVLVEASKMDGSEAPTEHDKMLPSDDTPPLPEHDKMLPPEHDKMSYYKKKVEEEGLKEVPGLVLNSGKTDSNPNLVDEWEKACQDVGLSSMSSEESGTNNNDLGQPPTVVAPETSMVSSELSFNERNSLFQVPNDTYLP